MSIDAEVTTFLMIVMFIGSAGNCDRVLVLCVSQFKQRRIICVVLMFEGRWEEEEEAFDSIECYWCVDI